MKKNEDLIKLGNSVSFVKSTIQNMTAEQFIKAHKSSDMAKSWAKRPELKSVFKAKQ